MPDPKWRPRCVICNRFVPGSAHDAYYDDYQGGYEDDTRCPAGTGCRSVSSSQDGRSDAGG